METGAITQNIDVAQVVLYAFWAFFILLIFYIRREDRREGYPLESDVQTGVPSKPNLLLIPSPKSFHMPDGTVVQRPDFKGDSRPINAERSAPWPGAPLVPSGDPMKAEVGPGSYAQRADVPDMDAHGHPRIQPLRAAGDFTVAEGDADPRGLPVVGADRKAGGKVTDVWVDRMEMMARYLEVQTEMGSVLLPITFASIGKDKVEVQALHSDQFAEVPKTVHPERVTLLEEERITAYYGAGTLYATPKRSESLL
ncbi:photosynthetic reaction center subunit H [Limibacillus halophilus]|jgi:photosynthetic reaction center H subunit